MAEFYAPDTNEPNTINTSLKSLFPIVLVGAGVGLLSYGLAYVIAELIINPLFCQDDPIAICANVAGISGNIALVFASVAGLFGLVRAGAYRALLIALAAIATLWGFGGWVAGMVWFVALALVILLSTATYAAFSWLARIGNFWIALGLMVVVVAAAHVLPLI
jgi:hypothetical protein